MSRYEIPSSLMNLSCDQASSNAKPTQTIQQTTFVNLYFGSSPKGWRAFSWSSENLTLTTPSVFVAATREFLLFSSSALPKPRVCTFPSSFRIAYIKWLTPSTHMLIGRNNISMNPRSRIQDSAVNVEPAIGKMMGKSLGNSRAASSEVACRICCCCPPYRQWEYRLFGTAKAFLPKGVRPACSKAPRKRRSESGT